jgi:hypothetical protein
MNWRNKFMPFQLLEHPLGSKNGVVYMFDVLFSFSIMAHIKIAVFKPTFPVYAQHVLQSCWKQTFEYGCSLTL